MLNKVFLIGRVGQDPDIKYGQDGNPFGRVSVATSDKWKDRDGQPQEKTTWHDVLLQGKTAEFASQHVKKGQLVHVEGSIDVKVVENEVGEKRYYHRVKAHRFFVLDWQDGKGAQQSFDDDDPPARPPRRTGGRR
jgi:single-strand DNA-binding protein